MGAAQAVMGNRGQSWALTGAPLVHMGAPGEYPFSQSLIRSYVC